MCPYVGNGYNSITAIHPNPNIFCDNKKEYLTCITHIPNLELKFWEKIISFIHHRSGSQSRYDASHTHIFMTNLTVRWHLILSVILRTDSQTRQTDKSQCVVAVYRYVEWRTHEPPLEFDDKSYMCRFFLSFIRYCGHIVLVVHGSRVVTCSGFNGNSPYWMRKTSQDFLAL